MERNVAGDAPRVALALITGDNWSEEDIRRLLGSVAPHVSSVYASYNGRKKRFPGWAKLGPGIPIVWDRFAWADDFAAARNHSFSLVPRDEYDFILWLDTDDELVAPEGLGPSMEKLDEYSVGLFARYDYGVHRESDTVVVEQYRERLLRAEVAWKWDFPIHEVCHGPMNAQFERTTSWWVSHWREPGLDEATRRRNRRIIARAARTHPEESRYQFYMANELLAEADSMDPSMPQKAHIASMAIKEYQKYLKMPQTNIEDVYHAQERIAELHRMMGSWNLAIDADLQCIKLMPSWQDAYLGIAQACLQLNDWGRMWEFANIACNLGQPITVAARESMSSSFTPLFLRAIANEQLGKLQEAIDDYEAALEVYEPPDNKVQDRIAEIREAMVEIDDPEESKDLRVTLRGTRPDRSICFYTNPIPDAWGPVSSPDKGVGGSELAVMKLAERFATDGWRTVVFGTPAPQDRGVAGGYEVWSSAEWRYQEPFTVTVGSRAPNIFEQPSRSQLSILWIHDVNFGGLDLPTDMSADLYAALTPWHRDHLMRLYDMPAEKMIVMPNGIDAELFSSTAPKEGPPKLIYASSPDRGLDVLLGMWPLIRKRYPDAELHVYYGWEMIDAIIAASGGSHPLEWFKAAIMLEIESLGGEDAGIHWHGRISQDALASEFARMHVWAYPTYFMETFCITALQAQLAGATPVTSDLAGLKHTVFDPRLRVDGFPNNSTYQRQWLNLLSDVLEHGLGDEVRGELREEATIYDWDEVYKRWLDVIEARVSFPAKTMKVAAAL